MKNVKKIIAILLALCMALTLAACGGGGDASPSASSGDSNAPTGASGSSSGDQTSAAGPEELGFYDMDYDYTQHDKFRFAYLVSGTGVMYDSFDTAFEEWAGKLNMEYGDMWAPAETNNEAFLAGVEMYANMGFDGLILDTDPNLCGSIADICNDAGVLWMLGMAQARDYSQPYSFNGLAKIGPLYTPNVGFDGILVGNMLAERLIEWKEEAHPDVPWEEVGYITLDFSLSPDLHVRSLGQEQAWAEKLPEFGEYSADPTINPRNFIVSDVATAGGFDQQTATNLVTQIFSNPPDPNIKVWLIAGAFWDFAAGASVAAENLGMTDNVCVTTFGAGANAIALWDADAPTSLRFALETASSVFAEAIVNAMWAMMAGFATPDTLWPEWCNKADKGDRYQLTDEIDPESGYPMVELDADGNPIILEEHNYATMILPMIWTDQENYQEFYGWVDLYQFGPDVTDEERAYPQFPLGTDIDAFNSRGTIPEEYAAYPTAD